MEKQPLDYATPHKQGRDHLYPPASGRGIFVFGCGITAVLSGPLLLWMISQPPPPRQPPGTFWSFPTPGEIALGCGAPVVNLICTLVAIIGGLQLLIDKPESLTIRRRGYWALSLGILVAAGWALSIYTRHHKP